MPHLRQPVKPPRHQSNRLPPPRPSANALLAPTVLPTSLVLVTAPTKLPPRPVSGHPGGTFLTIPTVGPLPPAPVNDPTVVRPPFAQRRPMVGPVARVPNAGPMFNPFMPLPRAHRGHHGRMPVPRR